MYILERETSRFYVQIYGLLHNNLYITELVKFKFYLI